MPGRIDVGFRLESIPGPSSGRSYGPARSKAFGRGLRRVFALAFASCERTESRCRRARRKCGDRAGPHRGFRPEQPRFSRSAFTIPTTDKLAKSGFDFYLRLLRSRDTTNPPRPPLTPPAPASQTPRAPHPPSRKSASRVPPKESPPCHRLATWPTPPSTEDAELAEFERLEREVLAEVGAG